MYTCIKEHSCMGILLSGQWHSHLIWQEKGNRGKGKKGGLLNLLCRTIIQTGKCFIYHSFNKELNPAVTEREVLTPEHSVTKLLHQTTHPRKTITKLLNPIKKENKKILAGATTALEQLFLPSTSVNGNISLKPHDNTELSEDILFVLRWECWYNGSQSLLTVQPLPPVHIKLGKLSPPTLPLLIEIVATLIQDLAQRQKNRWGIEEQMGKSEKKG